MRDPERDIADAASELPRVGPPAGALRALAERADRDGLLDVAWAQVDSPLGPLTLAATARGLVRVAYPDRSVDEILGALSRTVSPRILEAPARLDAIRRELEQYFAGERREFATAVDWSVVRGFGRDVLEACARIPFGEVQSYRDVARGAGNERAVRAAGNALGANLVPVVVPCHRVVRTGGELGGYTGGLARKRFLLELEGGQAELGG